MTHNLPDASRVDHLEVLALAARADVEAVAAETRKLDAGDTTPERRNLAAAASVAATRLGAIERDLAEARSTAGIPAPRTSSENVETRETREARRESRAREVRALAAGDYSPSSSPARITSEPSTYRKGDHSVSYFRDLYSARTGNMDAVDRLVRNDRELRALANSNQTSTIGVGGGSGGEFAPPAWLVSDFVKLARPLRVFADLAHHEELPSGVSSINLPRVATGTAAAVQASQMTSLQNTDLTTNSVSSSIVTIAGRQTASLQLLEQSGVNFDEVILGDLAADYAKQLDLQFISGSGSSGQLRGVTGIAGTTITYTDASPAVAGAGKFYSKLAQAIQALQTSRYMGATAIVLHPRRWAWVCAAFDNSNRPLIVPSGMSFNSLATFDATSAQGRVGEMLGLPVYTDPNITTTDGAGTNQDIVYVIKADDLWLYESGIRAEAFTSPLADSMGVLFRVYGYSASIPDRYASSVAVIRGSGCASPTF